MQERSARRQIADVDLTGLTLVLCGGCEVMRTRQRSIARGLSCVPPHLRNGRGEPTGMTEPFDPPPFAPTRRWPLSGASSPRVVGFGRQPTSSMSSRRQVWSIQACRGPYRRKAMNQLLPGIVWSQFFSWPAGASGAK